MENKPNIAKISIAVLLLIAIIIVAIILITNKGNNKEEEGSILAESEFESMQAKDIEIIYKEGFDKTIIKLTIENISNEDINKQTVNIMLLDKDGNTIQGIQNYIEYIGAKSTQSVYAEVLGDVSHTKKIFLQMPEIAQ